MIKIHCLMSCLCEIIKRRSEVDHRPFYFGVWDAPFALSEAGGLAYHAESLSHQPLLDQYERMFGLTVRPWHDPRATKEANRETLLRLLEDKPEHRYIMVMLDMCQLPGRETKANLSPFPHYLMVSKTADEDRWFVFDPDFRWEGEADKRDVLAAIAALEDGAGYVIDAERIVSPSLETVDRWFVDTFRPDVNPLTAQVRAILRRAEADSEGAGLGVLLEQLGQLKVLAVRKYGYEYALMYFQDTLGYSRDHFLRWANQIEDLAQGYSTAQYMSVKLAMTGNRALLPVLYDNLDEVDAIEREIKEEIGRQHEAWRAAVLSPSTRVPAPAEGGRAG
ncbi:hypothetical protein PA598K_02021 [Paenibacillus sp. 598K]|uniref:DUF6005 family protein n=1 Tax=Paenibacillus sp. 598K TaxID=1117987 RepID=UPI000FFA841B|nr:DUF6005 family protein [Paenibacillus sp. 598K]GBF73707.1 hypothetical protein PA598K_02021 [Paenibacillus sp. 598K]